MKTPLFERKLFRRFAGLIVGMMFACGAAFIVASVMQLGIPRPYIFLTCLITLSILNICFYNKITTLVTILGAGLFAAWFFVWGGGVAWITEGDGKELVDSLISLVTTGVGDLESRQLAARLIAYAACVVSFCTACRLAGAVTLGIGTLGVFLAVWYVGYHEVFGCLALCASATAAVSAASFGRRRARLARAAEDEDDADLPVHAGSPAGIALLAIPLAILLAIVGTFFRPLTLAPAFRVRVVEQTLDDLADMVASHYSTFSRRSAVFSLNAVGYGSAADLGGPVSLSDDLTLVVGTSNRSRVNLLRGSVRAKYTGNGWTEGELSGSYRFTSDLWKEERADSFDLLRSVSLANSSFLGGFDRTTVRVTHYAHFTSMFTLDRPEEVICKPETPYFNMQGELFPKAAIQRGDNYTITGWAFKGMTRSARRTLSRLVKNAPSEERTEFLDALYADYLPDGAVDLSEFTQGAESLATAQDEVDLGEFTQGMVSAAVTASQPELKSPAASDYYALVQYTDEEGLGHLEPVHTESEMEELLNGYEDAKVTVMARDDPPADGEVDFSVNITYNTKYDGDVPYTITPHSLEDLEAIQVYVSDITVNFVSQDYGETARRNSLFAAAGDDAFTTRYVLFYGYTDAQARALERYNERIANGFDPKDLEKFKPTPTPIWLSGARLASYGLNDSLLPYSTDWSEQSRNDMCSRVYITQHSGDGDMMVSVWMAGGGQLSDNTWYASSLIDPENAGPIARGMIAIADANDFALLQYAGSVDYRAGEAKRITKLITKEYLNGGALQPDGTFTYDDPVAAEDINLFDLALNYAQYLATYNTYTLKPAPVPDGVDFCDWFFSTHEGYCTYYATAMALMARYAGIPSRYTEGYSLAEAPLTDYGEYMLSGEQAHAWAELYFEGVGFIPFDALSLERYNAVDEPFQGAEHEQPEVDVPTPTPDVDLPERDDIDEPDQPVSLWWLWVIIAVVAVVGVVAGSAALYLKLRSVDRLRRKLGDVEAARDLWREILALMPRLDRAAIRREGETSLEYSKRVRTLLIIPGAPFDGVADAGMRAWYSPASLNERDFVLLDNCASELRKRGILRGKVAPYHRRKRG